MTDNLRRNARVISFQGGLLSDPVDEQNPCYYLENLLPKSSSGDGLVPRDGIEPLTTIETERTEGCVLFLVTLKESKNRQLVVMMNASTRRIVCIDDYVEQVGRRAVPPDTGDYPEPIPVPSSIGLRFLDSVSYAELGEEAIIDVIGNETGGECSYDVYFWDDNGIQLLKSGTVFADSTEMGEIKFDVPEIATGDYGCFAYLYNPANDITLYSPSYHEVLGEPAPVVDKTAFSVGYRVESGSVYMNLFDEQNGNFKGVVLSPDVPVTNATGSVSVCRQTQGGIIIMFLSSDSNHRACYYRISDIRSATNNSSVAPALAVNVVNNIKSVIYTSGSTDTDDPYSFNVMGKDVSSPNRIIYGSINWTSGSDFSTVINDGTGLSVENYAINGYGFNQVFIRSPFDASPFLVFAFNWFLGGTLRTLAGTKIVKNWIAGEMGSSGYGFIKYNASNFEHYNPRNNTSDSPISLPDNTLNYTLNEVINLDSVDVGVGNGKILFFNVSDGAIISTLTYNQTTFNYCYPIGWSLDNTHFYCAMLHTENGTYKFWKINYNAGTYTQLNVVGGTITGFSDLNDGTFNVPLSYLSPFDRFATSYPRI